MKLRNLRQSDAELMLEWMHDKDLCEHMHADFELKKIEDCKRFIEASSKNPHYVHFAIVNGADEYMGTVSLKNISFEHGVAEFGIVVRRSAIGKGYSAFAMREILKYAFNELNLNEVVWCVSSFNLRANRFYQKNNFKIKNEDISSLILEAYRNVDNLIWYGIKKEEFNSL